MEFHYLLLMIHEDIRQNFKVYLLWCWTLSKVKIHLICLHFLKSLKVC